MRAIALLSGGLDSIVATWAAAEAHTIVGAVTCDYGQRAAQREIEAAQAVAEMLHCDHDIIDISWLAAIGSSALTNLDHQPPAPAPEDLDDPRRAPETADAVWVPNRNGLLVNIAAVHADALNCGAIICGFNAEEAATFPDNSPEFVAAANRLFELSTQSQPRIISPTADLTKPQIVELAREIDAPIGHVYSCYRGEAAHCWRCESCKRLKRALQQAGAWDQWQTERFD